MASTWLKVLLFRTAGLCDDFIAAFTATFTAKIGALWKFLLIEKRDAFSNDCNLVECWFLLVVIFDCFWLLEIFGWSAWWKTHWKIDFSVPMFDLARLKHLAAFWPLSGSRKRPGNEKLFLLLNIHERAFCKPSKAEKLSSGQSAWIFLISLHMSGYERTDGGIWESRR